MADVYLQSGRSMSKNARLSLYSRHHHALDEEPLRKEEKQHGRDKHQRGSRHEQMALFGKDGIKSLQAQCHRPMAFTLQIDQGRVEIVPGVQHAKDGYGGDNRIRLWQDHMP
jgi:hypothetical protein